MSYQVLARKWRPKSFATLVGQDHVVRALTHALEKQRLHHAYLFTGTRGVGKTTLARIMAKALNCETGITATPCGACSSCVEIDSGRFIDYVELDAASNRGIDDMTQLLERSVYAPTRGRYKVYVIDEVHQLSGAAFNAMLKTLEEPPAHVKFILATTDPQKIPVTVLSRCLQFNLKQMPLGHIVDHLSRVLEAEAVPFELPALRQLARGAAGSMRDALSLLDQAIAHGAGKVEEDSVRAMLGTVSDEHLLALLDGLVVKDVQSMLKVAQMMDARSLSFDSGLQELATLFHRIALAQFAPEALLDEAERTHLAPYTVALDAEYLQLCYQIAIHGRDELPLAPDEYAGFVMTLLRLHAFRPERAGSQIKVNVSAAKPRQGAASRPDLATKAVTVVAVPVEVPFALALRPVESANGVESAVLADAGAWLNLVASLPVGMAKQLAQRCEMSERDGDRVVLRLDPLHKHLLGNQEKLQAALRERWGEKLRLELSVEAPVSETPAARRESSERERQERAVASITQDPFVRQVFNLFDVGIDQATIRPI